MAYNGWSNYETWCVKLWMDNDEGEYHYWRERTRAARSASSLAAELKEYANDNMPEVAGAYADLLNAALSEVDWYEIANAMLDDEGLKDDDDEDANADDA